ncbi:hypothetical protein KBB27_04560 [Patescibacteria group bacterium]|nr:hypothetical protein [Patescibacteria group bacterium]
MSTPLPKAVLLVKTSVEDAIKYVNELWQPLVLSGVSTMVASGVLAASVGVIFGGFLAESGVMIVVGSILYVVCLVLMVAIALGFDAHLTRRAIRLVEGSKETFPAMTSIKKIPSLLWIGLLQGLMSAALPIAFTLVLLVISLISYQGSVTETLNSDVLIRLSSLGLGAFGVLGIIACIVYVIYVATRLQMSSMAFLADEKRGMNALKASWAITEGRFWSILWRVLVLVVLYLAAMMVITLVFSILGDGGAANLLRMILIGAFQILIIVPSALFFQVHLYNHLKGAQK